jgi:hypothetical protein
MYRDCLVSNSKEYVAVEGYGAKRMWFHFLKTAEKLFETCLKSKCSVAPVSL